MRDAKVSRSDVRTRDAIRAPCRLRATTCAVSEEPLSEPVVACDLELLYTKEELIVRLLKKTLDREKFGHIRGLKSVTELKLTRTGKVQRLNRWMSNLCVLLRCWR